MKKNIIANLIGRFWGILSNFLFIPLYIHFLGFESYSIISFTLVIAGLMAVLDAGLSATLSREFARIDNSEIEKIRIFKTLESSYLIIVGIIIILVFSLSGILANKWLNLSAFDPTKVSFFLKIIGFEIGFQLLFRFYMGGLLGLEKQVKANIYQVIWGMFRNGLVVIAILFVPSLEMFFIWQTISTIVFALLLRISLNKTLTGQYKFDFPSKIEKSVFKNVWRFAGGMLLISLVASLNTQIDKLVISKLLPVESLGYYTLALSLGVAILVLISPISTALLPRFTALFSAGKKNEASLLFIKANLFVAIIVFSAMAIMTFFAKELIWIWTGEVGLAEHTFSLIPLIVFAYTMLAMQVLPYNIAIANGYTKLNNILGIVSLFFTLPGYWIATKYYGVIGAASVFCSVQIVTTFVYLYYINKKFIKIKIGADIYLKQIIMPLVLSLGIAYLFSLVPDFTSGSRIFTLIWIATSTVFTLLITTVLLVPNDTLNKALKSQISK